MGTQISKARRVMAKWLVSVKRVVSYYVEVEANGSGAAEQVAMELDVDSSQQRGASKRTTSAEARRRLGEPWVKMSWYDLHEPGDVVVGQRSFGNRFSVDDLRVLRERLETLGLKVVDSWNGLGCDTVSFRCAGRKGTKPFTTAEREALEAPRPGVTDE